MKVLFAKTFLKDVKQTPKEILKSLGDAILEMEGSDNLATTPNCKKLQGSDCAYRIRIRTYRATFLFIRVEDTIVFQRILTRGQIYKKHI